MYFILFYIFIVTFLTPSNAVLKMPFFSILYIILEFSTQGLERENVWRSVEVSFVFSAGFLNVFEEFTTTTSVFFFFFFFLLLLLLLLLYEIKFSIYGSLRRSWKESTKGNSRVQNVSTRGKKTFLRTPFINRRIWWICNPIGSL